MTERDVLDGLFAAWRDGDALRSGAHFALDGRYWEARREPIAGRAAIVAHFTRFFRDGPPWRLHVDGVVAEGSQAAVRYRFEIEKSPGAWSERSGCAFVTFEDGTIAEWREYEG